MKRHRNRFVLTGFAALLLASGGCSRVGLDSVEQGSEAAEATGRVESLTFVTMGDPDSEMSAFQEIFAAFEAETGYAVDIQAMPDLTQYENIMKTRFATQDAPDVFYFFAGPNANFTLNAPKQLREMTDEPFVSRIAEEIRNFYMTDGKLYGVPWGAYNAMGVLYNKRVFDALGLDVPTTYPALLKTAEAVRSAGIVPFYEAARDGWPTQIYSLSAFQSFVLPEIGGEEGVRALRENRLRLTEIPALEQVFRRQYELLAKGLYNENLMSATYEMQQEAIASGNAAMAFQADWMLPLIEERFGPAANDIGFFPLPSDTDEGIVSLYPPKQLFVNKRSPRAEAAAQLVRFMTRPESLKTWYEHNPGIPAYEGIVADLYPAQREIERYMEEGRGEIQIQLRLDAVLADYEKITQELLGTGDVAKALQKLDLAYRQDGKNKNLPGF